MVVAGQGQDKAGQLRFVHQQDVVLLSSSFFLGMLGFVVAGSPTAPPLSRAAHITPAAIFVDRIFELSTLFETAGPGAVGPGRQLMALCSICKSRQSPASSYNLLAQTCPRARPSSWWTVGALHQDRCSGVRGGRGCTLVCTKGPHRKSRCAAHPFSTPARVRGICVRWVYCFKPPPRRPPQPLGARATAARPWRRPGRR